MAKKQKKYKESLDIRLFEYGITEEDLHKSSGYYHLDRRNNNDIEVDVNLDLFDKIITADQFLADKEEVEETFTDRTLVEVYACKAALNYRLTSEYIKDMSVEERLKNIRLANAIKELAYYNIIRPVPLAHKLLNNFLEEKLDADMVKEAAEYNLPYIEDMHGERYELSELASYWIQVAEDLWLVWF